ncbi:ribosomal protein L9 [Caldicellulosiruptor saccharolyticus DSM 8903]|uniref:Large ribosomal subunit protein bL9 n=1 Tax=Caldicellulosiruptor saccharolyticus (strain ATCC 43494 / DSM 8903 / Tp8T 6331) TaxID=351627 RepID=RL9_CALS8|nr:MULTISPECIES: 50S ribosomal protein L9 [Caldicellulosiruptor]A4XJI0.1 RecName: Full=Large ribosomal subunit protein bL9; AltName: Full=50S ribosomal protein L9 [Caldicellulosiruptor saccharolyticus DSM 8903]ABP67065.1 ribosomal protein L9 [Caldicellulosiruptor saccharolyticus DSM 8903]
MKVVLLQDVKGLGKKDSIVEVNDGYARNYLIPRKLAAPLTEGLEKHIKEKKEAEQKKKEKELMLAKDLADKLEKSQVIIKAKAGENGKLFGSITNKEIADEIKRQLGIDMDKKKIELEDPIKQIGSYEVSIRLYQGIVAKLKVHVTSS